MASARAPSGGTPTMRIGVDLTALRNAPNIAREAGRATAREISNAFKSVQAEQRLALEQARQTTATLRGQQAQVTATTRAESAQRIASARAESAAQQQAARAAASATIEEQRRITATHRSEIRAREQAARAGQGGGFSLAGIGREALGAFGIGLGVSGAIQLARSVDELARVAAQAERTRGAYDRLATGVGASASSMLSSMRVASRGLISDADLVLNANRAMLLGVADTAEEMGQLLEVARVRGQAVQISTSEAFTRLAQGIGKREIEILDELGIVIKLIPTYEEYAKSIGKTANQLTEAEKSAAIFNKVIKGSAPLVAAAADAADTAADKYERLDAAQDNLAKSMGNVLKDAGANNITMWARLTEGANNYLKAINQIQQIGLTTPLPTLLPSAANRSGNTPPSRGGSSGPQFNDDQTAALRQRDEGFAAIERESGMARLESRRSYERQLASVTTNYQKQTLREAEDFARQRANAETKFNLSLLDVAQDSARQRLKWEQDLARSIAQAQSDSAERIADAREDTAKRIADLDKDFKKDQAKRERDFRDDMLSAAGRLDAVALLELRKDRAKELKERKDSYEESRADLQEQLAERIADENESLAKSIRQQQEANQRRIEEQAENDALRIQEMKDAFEAQKVEQDIERGIMMARRAKDHAAQLTEMATAQAERIQQIKDNALAERAQFTEESNKFLEEVGIHNQKWLDAEEAKNATVLRMHQDLLDAQRRALLTPGHPSLADPYVDRALLPGTTPVIPPPVSNNSNRSTSVGAVSIVVNAVPGQSPYDIGLAVREQMTLLLEELAN